MYRPLALYIGLRYTRAKRKNHFISFISATSMIGIALGVAVLITVLSVMNGFDYEIHKRFFGMAPEITLNQLSGKIENWRALQKNIEHSVPLQASAPFVGGQGLLVAHGRVVPAITTGILPFEEARLLDIESKMIAGHLDDLKAHKFGIILGQTIANTLGLLVGDPVTLMIPKVNMTLAGALPRFKRFTVVGIFAAGSGFNFDSSLAFIHLQDAQKLFEMGEAVSGLRIKIQNVYDAPRIALELQKHLPADFQVGNWTEQFGAFFKAIQMEKTMMFLILLLIVAVAAFNLISSLVMIVNDKQAEIAILRTLGARPRMILAIFIIQGAFVGCLGTCIGVVSGIYLSLHATEFVNAIQNFLHIRFLSSSVYFVDYLPSKLEIPDVIHVTGIALLMSLLATLYPAWRASKTEPAEALRYE